MYEAFAAIRGWTFEAMDIKQTDELAGSRGYKEASATISGTNVFGLLKHESGVHRVQRVPLTEKDGRMHTSAATVAVMPEAEEVDVTILEKDLRIDVYRAGGAGGQHVNKTESAVRITHIPTGLQVAMQDERSQIAVSRRARSSTACRRRAFCSSALGHCTHLLFFSHFLFSFQNRIKAMTILRSRLYEQTRQQEAARRNKLRADQIGSGNSGERIRTYNFPASRVTDHRINLSLFGIDKMLEGQMLDEIIVELLKNDRRKQLQDM